MDEQFQVCPNPQCGKMIPSYADKCKYCNTRIDGSGGTFKNHYTTFSETQNKRQQPPPQTNHEDPVILSKPPWPQLTPMTIDGVIHGKLMVSPTQVHVSKSLPMFKPRAEIKIELNQGSTLMHQTRSTRSAERDGVGVFQGGLVFPDKCPVCMQEVDHFEFFEASVPRESLGKVSFNSQDVSTERVRTALTGDRFWYRIPFSKKHSLKNDAVGFASLLYQGKRNQATLQLANREYAREFLRVNHLTKGKWLTRYHIISHISGFWVACGGLGLFLGIIFARSMGNAGVFWSWILSILALAGFFTGIYLYFHGSKGEPL